MNSAESSRDGIILFEVMLATAIFCLVGLALSSGLGDVASSMREANRKNQIRLGLESHLAEARAFPVEMGVRQDKADADGVTYEREWKVVHMANKDKASLPGLYLLTVRAHWTDRNQQDTDEASVRVYRPQL